MSGPTTRSRSKPCPLCRAPAVTEHSPFCSRGCRDRDLLRWLGGGYAIPGRPADDEECEGLDRVDGPPL